MPASLKWDMCKLRMSLTAEVNAASELLCALFEQGLLLNPLDAVVMNLRIARERMLLAARL